MSKRSDLSPPARRACPSAAGSAREVAAFLAEARARAPRAERRARAADLRARRHHEPAADLGPRLPAAGRDVRRRGRGRRARGAARLLPRPRRGARLALGLRHHGAEAADDRDRLPGRAHPDRPGARPCRARGREAPVAALVFVGDAMEENVDSALRGRGRLGLRNTRAFMFHEGSRPGRRAAPSARSPG